MTQDEDLTGERIGWTNAPNLLARSMVICLFQCQAIHFHGFSHLKTHLAQAKTVLDDVESLVNLTMTMMATCRNLTRLVCFKNGGIKAFGRPNWA